MHDTRRSVRPAAVSVARRLARPLVGFLGLGIALALWQYFATRSGSLLLPPFLDVVGNIREFVEDGGIRSDLVPSLIRFVEGYGLSILIGIPIGIALGRSPRLHETFSPAMDFFRSIPVSMLLPVALVVFGLGSRLVLAVIVLGAVWPVIINTADGVRRIEPLYLDAAKTIHLPMAYTVARIVPRAAITDILAGLRTALSVSLAVLVVAEMFGATEGIGYFVILSQQQFRVKDTYAGVVMLGGIGLIMDSLFLFVERRLGRAQEHST